MSRKALGWAALTVGLIFGAFLLAESRTAYLGEAVILGGWTGLVIGGIALILEPTRASRILFAAGLCLLALPGALALWTYTRVPPQWAFWGLDARVHLAYDALLLVVVGLAVFGIVRPNSPAARILATLLVVAGVLAIYVFSPELLNGIANGTLARIPFGLVSAAFGFAVLALGLGSLRLTRDHPTRT